MSQTSHFKDFPTHFPTHVAKVHFVRVAFFLLCTEAFDCQYTCVTDPGMSQTSHYKDFPAHFPTHVAKVHFVRFPLFLLLTKAFDCQYTCVTDPAMTLVSTKQKTILKIHL